MSDTSSHTSQCAGVAALATAAGLAAPTVANTQTSKYPTLAEMVAKLRPLKTAGVNVIVSCGYNATQWTLTRALMQMDWTPMATFMTASYIPGWEGEYLFHPSSWAPGKKTIGQFSNMSSSDFASRFATMWGSTAQLTYHGAAAFGGLCALAKSIEDASSVETQAVAAQLYAQTFTEFYGTFSFGTSGQAILPFLILQHDPSGLENILYPPAEASSTLPTFPAPSWKARFCKRYGPATSAAWGNAGAEGWDSGLTVLDVECSGHGTCNAAGQCECTGGHTGAACAVAPGGATPSAGGVCGTTEFTNVLYNGSSLSEMTSNCLPSLPSGTMTTSYGALC